ncbi:sucrose nonfermenting 4-like protein [Phoenix dactylifera]|uniref:Sucrose nonfermenting 4-like protein n=1 Tax=Phoenix dactylifera TaxID=42345 RepID=A0A8B7BGK1_PHODC|nr:sucrose nonfermenting 4-like protein [Phoenix dactylifera]
MVLTRLAWPYGGHHVFICGSFLRWIDPRPMMLVDGSLTEFQAFFDLPPGAYQYRFLVDGIWRFDEQKPCLSDEYGTVNNVIFVEEPSVSHAAPPHELYVPRNREVVDGNSLYTASLPTHMPLDPLLQTSDAAIQVSRDSVSRLLSAQTIYDIIPSSSKIPIMDVKLPVKQAFHIMYEEGLAVVPLWDDCRANVTGMLTASDFILILRELHSSVRVLANEELEMHTVSAWKEGKLQIYGMSTGPLILRRRPLISVLDDDLLNDVALKIVHSEISAVPILRSLLQDGSSMPLLNLASLPGILKFICTRFGEYIGSLPLLQYQIFRIPIGTWMPNTGRGSVRQLAILQRNAPLSSALDLLLEAGVSSIPIVDDHGSLIDVYSRSDIMALAKDDMYARIQLDQMTMEQALEQVYQANGRRRCHTCLRSTSFGEILELLSDPGVRRLVVIDPRTRLVEGMISLRDVFTFLLG